MSAAIATPASMRRVFTAVAKIMPATGRVSKSWAFLASTAFASRTIEFCVVKKIKVAIVAWSSMTEIPSAQRHWKSMYASVSKNPLGNRK
jgi:hypothetical protein